MAKRRKQGEGTLRLRKDGRWEGRIVVGYDDKGLPLTKNVTAKTKTECAAKLETLKEQYGKSGTGCVTMINDHLYEGRYSPINAYGKREAHNIYAKTREECEEKLAEMITQVKDKIKAEKEQVKR